MKLYNFELGRKKELCLEELFSLLGKNSFVEKNFETAIFKLDLKKPQILQNHLGGTIKIVEILEDIGGVNIDSIKTVLEKILVDNLENVSGKIAFCISLLGFKNLKDINSKELLNFSKKIIKSLGKNCRFVNKAFDTPKSSTIFKAKVLQKGIDINFIQGENKIYIGKTVAIQNVDEYSARDYEKPKRDAKVGMTPPKLAQIMINFAGRETKRIYDPFCGTGSILMEAMLMGKDSIGSDIEKRMIDYSEENLQWLKKEFNCDKNFRLFERDARFITKKLIPEKIDAIVTESYLGEPLLKEPDSQKQEMIFRELANLHLNWLKAAKEVLERKSKIVLCLPSYQTSKGLIKFPKFEEIAKITGYKILDRLMYDRPDQIVAREIIILET